MKDVKGAVRRGKINWISTEFLLRKLSRQWVRDFVVVVVVYLLIFGVSQCSGVMDRMSLVRKATALLRLNGCWLDSVRPLQVD